MEFEINGKERELKFGIGFIRKLDDVYKVDYNGIEFGMGLNMANAQLQQFNPTALSEVIRSAVKGMYLSAKWMKQLKNMLMKTMV